MKKLLNLLAPAMLASAAGFYKVAPARRTVDGALVHFNKALSELRAVKAQEDAEAERQEKAAMAADIAAEAAREEARRAARTIAKIEDLLN